MPEGRVRLQGGSEWPLICYVLAVGKNSLQQAISEIVFWHDVLLSLLG